MATKRRGTENLRRDNKSGVWNVYWKEGDRVRTRSTGTRDIREAKRVRDAIMDRIDAERANIVAKPVERSSVTWEDIEAAYKGDDDVWPTNAKTRTRYEVDLARIGAFLAEADILPAEATLSTVKEFVADMRRGEDGLSTSSVKHALTVFSCAMSAAAFHDLIEKNPVKEFDRKRLRCDAPDMDPPLNGDFERLLPDLERLEPRLVLFAEFLHRTGCRSGEALHARAGDIFGRPGALHIHLHEGVTRDKPRAIRLNAAEGLLNRLPNSGRLFPELPTSVYDVSSLWGRFWKRRLTEAKARAAAEGRGLTPWELRRWRLHDLRGAFAINAIAAGANHYRLSEHLGHTTFATTQIYLEASRRLPVEQREGLELFWRGEKQSPESDQPVFDERDADYLEAQEYDRRSSGHYEGRGERTRRAA